MAFLLFKELFIKFENKTIVDNFNLNVEKGDKLVIKGPSGKGKTTLINALLGFERNWIKGSIYFNDKIIDRYSISDFRSHISYVPQDVNFFKGSVRDFIFLPFYFKNNKQNMPLEDSILELFDIFILDKDLLNKNMDTISGGEKQRIALMSILMMKKDILLLDEPTSALDILSKKAVINHIMHQKLLTVISASHDTEWIGACSKIKEI